MRSTPSCPPGSKHWINKVDALDAKLSTRIGTLDHKVDALDAKLSARIEALDTQIKFVLAALALLLALGLIDTVPRLLS